MRIAIDGPAGSGKSTIARMLSERLGIPYLNTGMVYRLFAYIAMTKGTTHVDSLFNEKIQVRVDVGKTEVFWEGVKLEEELRTEEVGQWASLLAQDPTFRKAINQLFWSIIGSSQMVVEGRDASTHIIPDADLKIFITASPEERARRRYIQLMEQGLKVDYHEVLKNLLERDERDARRKVAPLKPTEGALIIDTTGKTPEEVLQEILHLVASKERGY
ncbi:cytidylate kinase [Thermocrinis albus DSM 14484]|uniref:Cytidylate kinase n=1 Tax=Thermocrinis albus (strain DSM 14484 / JCM 11386 / HI 11/12) TaxID=638303 RepID=D3SPJ9_THEAH|nr:(d)CMP kinase [Thermocrinis albus]ADC89086.1 cytidylate kinase [Thermocrinis albus DSM 14484]